MPQSSYIENELLLDVGVNDANIHCGGNDTQNIEVGEDIYSIHSSEGGVENMEFGEDVGGIDESGGDIVNTQIHGGIDGNQLIAEITNIFTSYCRVKKLSEKKLRQPFSGDSLKGKVT
jgi:hypothetical protein